MSARERPGTWGGALAALVAAGVGLATAFGVSITPQEHDAILTFTGAVAVAAPLVGALFDHANARTRAGEAAVTAVAATLTSPDKLQAAAALDARIEELQKQREALS